MTVAAGGEATKPVPAPPPPGTYDTERAALLERVLCYNPDADIDLLQRAFDLGASAHGGQRRGSGELYYYHPITVAGILADFHLDDSSIATALLHDVVEDTGVSRHDIAAEFGREIADLVTGVTKLSKIEEREAFVGTREEAQAENFRKLILAVAADARVLLVKLADRLHNMRTLSGLPASKRERIAQETMEVYAPLAGRMGMQEMREELEDLAFRTLTPGARVSVLRRLVTLRRRHGEMVIPDVEREISETLAAIGLNVEVEGRQKRPYSIWRKMQRDNIGFESLSDIVAFRTIVKDAEACYRALGALHGKWRAVPGRFKDYMSNPKGNGYNSIHTTVIGPRGWRVELQIRTREMHEAAEHGVAAHWSYRDGVRFENPYSVEPTMWLRDVLHRLEQGAPPAEFLEHVKLEMYHDQVFCFTPQGDVKRLPRGATALDFAYAVHTRVGNSCVGARIDGHQAPFWKELRNGQTVQILRSDGQHPSPDWEDMVITGRAKSAIRRALRDLERGELSRFGRQLLERSFTRAGYDVAEEDLLRALAALDIPDTETLYTLIGESEITPEAVLTAADPSRAASEEIARREEPSVFLRGAQSSPVHRFCTHCNPIPFERIVGVVDRVRGGVLVHRIDCIHLEEAEDDAEGWLDIFWGKGADAAPRYRSRVELILANEPGALGAVCVGIGALSANIDNLVIADRKPSYYRVEVDLEVRDSKHLYRILKTLDKQARVDQVRRIAGHDLPLEPIPPTTE